MEALEVKMKKQNIYLDTSSTSSSGLPTSGYALNASSSSSSNQWLIDSRASYQIAKDKSIFLSLSEYNTKQIFVGEEIF
jgi:hypothetical protein